MVRCHLFLAAPLSVHHLKLVSMPIGIKPGYVASGWAWHSRQVTWSPRRVSFDPSNVLPWAWQEVKDEAMPLSVNEADYSCSNLRAAGLRGRWRGRRVGVVV